MGDPWLFRPIPGGGGGGASVCPTCSTAHFPFCPPPPSFDRAGYPGGDPLRRYPPGFPQPPPPFHRTFNDPSFDRPPLAPVPFPTPYPTAGRAAEPWEPSQRFVPSEFLEREGFHKRMRVEEPFPTSFPPPRILSDDERRISLIRDHGRQDAAPFGEDQRSNGEYRVDNYDHSVHGPPGIGFAAGNNRFPPPDTQYIHRSHLVQTKPHERYQNFPERESFERREFDASNDGVPSSQMGNYLYERKDFETRDFHTSNAAFNPQIEDYLHRQTGHRFGDSIGNTENFAARVPEEQSLCDSQSHRHGDSFRSTESYRTHVPEEWPIYDSQHNNYSIRSPANHMPPALKEQLPLYDFRREVSYPMHDYGSRVSYDKYSSHGQQLHPTESPSYRLPNQSKYPVTDAYWMATNAVNHEQESSHPVHAVQQPLEKEFGLYKPQHAEVMQSPSEVKHPIPEDICRPFERQTVPLVEQSGALNSKQDDYLPVPAKSSSYNTATLMLGERHIPQTYPPLPSQIRPPLHQEPSPPLFRETSLSLMSEVPPVPSPAPAITCASVPLLPPAYPFSDTHPLSQPHPYNELSMHDGTRFAAERLPFISVTTSKQYLEEGGPLFPLKNYSKDKCTIIDACLLFKTPHRASRPDHIVIILRGLPGSGKSYLAKALRDIEVENGGNAPRIHAMDDYFMIEVEKKVDDNESSKSSGSVRGKRPITKKVIEYCYEPEMEEAYRSSMLKAFKKTLDEGIFTFVIVDDRNLRVADFAQFWAIAKRSGYEVYLLEATYKDPTGCAARNVHGFTLDDIQKMATQWEEAPSLYLKLDIQTLFHGDNLNQDSIQEVDMDTDDGAMGEDVVVQLQDRNDVKMVETKSSDDAPDTGSLKVGDRWDAEEDEDNLAGVKELGKSKWSEDFDAEVIENSDGAKGKLNALSGLIQTYGKGEKSVHWGDRVDKSGFSIGAIKKQSTSSLIIGPGFGYNLKSNPLSELENPREVIGRGDVSESKKRFYEQLRAEREGERESFKAVFDRRRQRIGGLYDAEDE